MKDHEYKYAGCVRIDETWLRQLIQKKKKEKVPLLAHGYRVLIYSQLSIGTYNSNPHPREFITFWISSLSHVSSINPVQRSLQFLPLIDAELQQSGIGAKLFLLWRSISRNWMNITMETVDICLNQNSSLKTVVFCFCFCFNFFAARKDTVSSASRSLT